MEVVWTSLVSMNEHPSPVTLKFLLLFGQTFLISTEVLPEQRLRMLADLHADAFLASSFELQASGN